MRGDHPVVSAASLIVSPSFTNGRNLTTVVSRLSRVEEIRSGPRFCCGMRTLLAVFALALAIPATASADTVRTGTTSTGQRLRISIETPYDGETAYGTSAASMQGHATIDGQGSS